MSAFISTSSYGQPAPFAGQQLSNAPLAPSTSSVLGKKRDADDVGFEGESQETMMAMSQETASTIPTSAAIAAPAFKRRLTDATVQTSDMMDDGMNSSIDPSQQMHAFGAMHALPQGSLNLYAPGQQNAGFYSGTIPISPSAYSQQQQQQQMQDGFFAHKPEQRHLLRHLSIPNFPGSAAVSTSGACSPAFSTFSTTDGTSLADSEMPFELDSPDHRDEDEGMMMDNYTYAQHQQQQQQQPFYDSYNGQGWYDDDHMAGRYTGNNGDNYASKLENIMGHV